MRLYLGHHSHNQDQALNCQHSKSALWKNSSIRYLSCPWLSWCQAETGLELGLLAKIWPKMDLDFAHWPPTFRAKLCPRGSTNANEVQVQKQFELFLTNLVSRQISTLSFCICLQTYGEVAWHTLSILHHICGLMI